MVGSSTRLEDVVLDTAKRIVDDPSNRPHGSMVLYDDLEAAYSALYILNGLITVTGIVVPPEVEVWIQSVITKNRHTGEPFDES